MLFNTLSARYRLLILFTKFFCQYCYIFFAAYEIWAQVRKSVDSPPGMLTEDHHHTVHEERQVCYSSHLRPKPLHL